MKNEDLVYEIQHGINTNENLYSLYQNNLPLIRKCCSKYTNYEEMEDLMQVAFEGLTEAVYRYDASKDTAFVTYCLIWVKQSVLRHIEENSSVVRIPTYTRQRIIRYKRFCNDFMLCNGYLPPDDLAAEQLELPQSEIELIKQHVSFACDSLDETKENEEGKPSSLVDELASDEDIEADATEKVYQEKLQEELWDFVEKELLEREAETIKMRYKNSATLEQIAEKFGVSRQRVQQINKSAINKLRSRSRKIRHLYDDSSMFYRDGISAYKNHGLTSLVEMEVVKNIDKWL